MQQPQQQHEIAIKQEPVPSDEEPTLQLDEDGAVITHEKRHITKCFGTGRNTRFYRDTLDKIRRATLHHILANPEPQEMVAEYGGLRIPLNYFTMYKTVKDLSKIYKTSQTNVSKMWRVYSIKTFGEKRRWPGTFVTPNNKVYPDSDLPSTAAEAREWIIKYANDDRNGL